MAKHPDSCECFVCRAKTVNFGSVPGGTRRTRVMKAHEMPKQPAVDSWGAAPARHNGVPLLHADSLEPVTLKEQENNRHSIKTRLEAVKAAGTIKE